VPQDAQVEQGGGDPTPATRLKRRIQLLESESEEDESAPSKDADDAPALHGRYSHCSLLPNTLRHTATYCDAQKHCDTNGHITIELTCWEMGYQMS